MHVVIWGPESDAAALAGAVLAHDLTDRAGATLLRKGAILAAADASQLSQASAPVHLIVPAPTDLHETVAATRLAALLAGAGVEALAPRQGRVQLRARAAGLLRLDRAALQAANTVPDVAVYTRFDGQVVGAGALVAEVKVVPLVVPASCLAAAEAALGRAGAAIDVRPFVAQRIAVLVRTAREGRIERLRASIANRLALYGSTDVSISAISEEPQAIAAAYGAAIDAGASLVLLAGGSFSDPLDPALAALAIAGARMERQGLPAHPGSMTWLAYLRGRPLLGLASCGWFSATTAADLVLARLCAGDLPSAADLAGLGEGGLLSAEMAFRFRAEPGQDSDAPRP